MVHIGLLGGSAEQLCRAQSRKQLPTAGLKASYGQLCESRNLFYSWQLPLRCNLLDAVYNRSSSHALPVFIPRRGCMTAVLSLCLKYAPHLSQQSRPPCCSSISKLDFSRHCWDQSAWQCLQQAVSLVESVAAAPPCISQCWAQCSPAGSAARRHCPRYRSPYH